MPYMKKMISEIDDDLVEKTLSNQVYVNDITWSSKSTASYQSRREKNIDVESLPRQLTFDIPATVMEQVKKDSKNEHDIIEQFIYNTLTRKYMHEVWHCQIWILF